MLSVFSSESAHCSSANQSQLSEQYESERYCLFPSLLKPPEVAKWIGLIADLPARRVRVDGQAGEWDEKSIPSENPMHKWVIEPSLVNFLR